MYLCSATSKTFIRTWFFQFIYQRNTILKYKDLMFILFMVVAWKNFECLLKFSTCREIVHSFVLCYIFSMFISLFFFLFFYTFSISHYFCLSFFCIFSYRLLLILFILLLNWILSKFFRQSWTSVKSTTIYALKM